MKRQYLIAAALALIGFVGLGIHYTVTSQHKLQYQDVQLKSKGADIRTLQIKYDLLNKELDTEIQQKGTSEERLKQLEGEKQELQKKQQELEAQLQAKLQQREAEANRVAAAAQRATQVSATAYAAGNDGSAKMFIYNHESGNNPGAINRSSGACGLGQALPCSKMPCSLSDYACQDNFFTGYMQQRYGSWENARAFWLSHQWW